MTTIGRLLYQLYTQARAFAPAAMHCHMTGEGEVAGTQLQCLQGLMDSLPIHELSPTLPDLNEWQQNCKRWGNRVPPCYATELHNDPHLTLIIFNLRDTGCELPLHDHPGMHGFVRVLRGKLLVTSYTRASQGFTSNQEQLGDLTPVLLESSKIVTAADQTCMLTPTLGNYHRIEAVDGGASFLDLLMPSYRPPTIDCHYYDVVRVEQNRKEDLWLRERDCPDHYWTENWKYSGPVIEDDETECLI